MNGNTIAERLAGIAARPGLRACALVDSTTGLVWTATPHAGADTAHWEAAVDYWRLYRRQRAHFASLGPLGAAVMYHREGALAVLPCSDDPPLLLVALGGHRGVDWIECQRLARALGAAVASVHAHPQPAAPAPVSHARPGGPAWPREAEAIADQGHDPAPSPRATAR